MPLFASVTALRIIDAVAIVLNQSYQLARARLASAASPVLRMLAERASRIGIASSRGRDTARSA